MILRLCAPTLAAEKWSSLTWDGSAEGIAAFEALCAERGLTSADVLEANGLTEKTLPSDGIELLVPASKSAVFDTWMEVQDRGGGPKPLVTVRLHGVPDFARAEKETAEPSRMEPDITPAVSPKTEKTDTPPETPPSQPQPVLPDDGALVFDPALTSRDIIIPNPPVLTPMVGPPPRRNTQNKMMWPVSGKISSGFGRRGRRSMHTGIDMPMPSGTPILAALDGVVKEVAPSGSRSYRGYGNIVLIDHGNGIATWYAHCSKFNAVKGQKVRQGEVIAFVGNTGRTTTHHVHFEVRKDGKAVNPLPYMMPR